VLNNPEWPSKWPFYPQDFSRQDETPDKMFYSEKRLVTHIDDPAIAALTKYYGQEFKPGADILDICSSWISHFPKDGKFGKTVGLGMNEYELSQNKQLTSFDVQDLNLNPILPYEKNSFDYVTCVVSVDYLTRPLEIFSEISRVLRPGGKAIISQSNRCFPSKAINIWLNTSDLQHVFIIGAYFHYAGGFEPPESEDISPNPGRSDPLYIISASKK
jgi:SAM-dependent methyltransferase